MQKFKKTIINSLVTSLLCQTVIAEPYLTTNYTYNVDGKQTHKEVKGDDGYIAHQANQIDLFGNIKNSVTIVFIHLATESFYKYFFFQIISFFLNHKALVYGQLNYSQVFLLF